MPELSGKLALVTGGARDIGRSVAIKLAQAGANVVVNYRTAVADAEATVAAIEAAGAKGVAVPADVTREEDVKRLVKEAAAAGEGRIDILVNVAGGLVARKRIEEMDTAFWNEVITLNLTSTFLVTKHALPLMPDGASIVNFSSQAARDGGGPGASAYATSKAGVANFTRAMAKELGARKIRVNAVAPGMIATKFHDTFTKPEVRQRVAGMTPLGREGQADEVGDAVVFLASSKSSFVNGESLEVNGGIFFA
ncbi:MAG: SDR family oxidoreductase [Opitutaceae bacterium]|nr:SDR family oxidoreductase [Opitutaceae bacterium]